MNRTLESIFKDIDILGINGGYDVEQLLTPNDCRILKNEIERLNNIINELEKWLEYSINEHTNVIKSNNDIYWETMHKEKYEDRILIMSLVLDKLKELKEK